MMLITRRIALRPETCFRCEQLGLPPFQIQPGDTMIEAATHLRTLYSCEDCYARLKEEISSENKIN